VNRAELDEWFAKANDVLTDWPNPFEPDVMHARADDAGPDGDDLSATPDGVGDEGAWRDYYDLSFLRVDPEHPVYLVSGYAGASLVDYAPTTLMVSEWSYIALDGLGITAQLAATPVRESAEQFERDCRWQTTIDARRNRNTGPPNPVGMDGRRRR
jgi:hypothetical protein